MIYDQIFDTYLTKPQGRSMLIFLFVNQFFLSITYIRILIIYEIMFISSTQVIKIIFSQGQISSFNIYFFILYYFSLFEFFICLLIFLFPLILSLLLFYYLFFLSTSLSLFYFQFPKKKSYFSIFLLLSFIVQLIFFLFQFHISNLNYFSSNIILTYLQF